MRDYYRDGYDKGYGKSHCNYDNDYPKTDSDNYSYQRGVEEGRRRKEISDELDREYFDK